MREALHERAASDSSEFANDNVHDESEDKRDHPTSAKSNLGQLLNVFEFGARICELQVRFGAWSCYAVWYLRFTRLVASFN